MSEDEDWFEQALREETDSETETSNEETEDRDPAESLEAAFDTEQTAETTETESSDDDAEELFEQDFASALQETPSGPEEQPPENEDTEEFADEVPDSDIEYLNLGIDGLDAMIEGGIPNRSLMVTIGPPGSGKTTFGLQFLHEGLRQGEPAVYITLEESAQRIVRSATEKGFPYDEYVDSGILAVVDIDALDMANSLRTIQSDLVRLINEFGATRLVLDSVSLLEMMFQDRATRRNEIYAFTKNLKEAGITTMLTSEVSNDNPYVSRHGIVEYLTDAVFVLQYIRPEDFQETRMAVEIQKIRDANHSREKKPYEIDNTGISVYRQATIF